MAAANPSTVDPIMAQYTHAVSFPWKCVQVAMSILIAGLIELNAQVPVHARLISTGIIVSSQSQKNHL